MEGAYRGCFLPPFVHSIGDICVPCTCAWRKRGGEELYMYVWFMAVDERRLAKESRFFCPGETDGGSIYTCDSVVVCSSVFTCPGVLRILAWPYGRGLMGNVDGFVSVMIRCMRYVHTKWMLLGAWS